MQNYNIRAIGETILMAVILAMLILLNADFLGLAQLIIFLIPLPITIIYARYDFKYALLCILAALLLSSVFIDPILAGSILFMILIPTAAFCYSYKKELKFSKTFISIAAAYVIAIVFEYTVIIKMQGNITFIKIIEDIASSAKVSLDSVEKMYIDAGMGKQQVEQVLDVLRQTFTKSNMLMIIPGLLGVVSIISSYLSCFIGQKIFNKLKVKSNYNIEISNIYIYNMLLAFSIIVGCIGLILKSRNIIIGNYIYYTVQMTIGFWLMMSGVSVAIYYLKRRTKLTNPIIALVIIFIFIMFDAIAYVYMAMGFIDSFVDFRRIGIKKGDKEQGEK